MMADLLLVLQMLPVTNAYIADIIMVPQLNVLLMVIVLHHLPVFLLDVLVVIVLTVNSVSIKTTAPVLKHQPIVMEEV
jgi:hypothetical protein